MTETARKPSPYPVLGLIAGMYALKVALKLGVGTSIGSPMITGDGSHNLADLVETALVGVAVYVSSRPPNERYPFGRKNVESVVRALIGLGLLYTALHFAAVSAAGLLSYAPALDARVRGFLPIGLPRHEPLRMDAAVLPWVLSITAVSAALSFLCSPYEIRAGRKGGHASMIAAGKEMRGDGLIELAILAGVGAEYLFNAAWLEYPFGLLVAAIIAHSGRELFMEGWHALLQHSLGKDVEAAVRETCVSLRGIAAVEQVTTFPVGSLAVCIAKILTDAPADAHDDLKKALKAHLAARLAELGHEETEFHLRFSNTPPEHHREAYAAIVQVRDGAKVMAIAPDLACATHFLICDVVRGEIVRVTAEPMPAPCGGDVVSWLEGKRVTTLRLFGDEPAMRHGGVTFAGAPSYGLRTLGLADPE